MGGMAAAVQGRIPFTVLETHLSSRGALAWNSSAVEGRASVRIKSCAGADFEIRGELPLETSNVRLADGCQGRLVRSRACQKIESNSSRERLRKKWNAWGQTGGRDFVANWICTVHRFVRPRSRAAQQDGQMENCKAAEAALDVLFGVSEDREHLRGKDIEDGRQIMVDLEAWQLKKLVAAAEIGPRCINVEALAAEVGLDKSLVIDFLTTAHTYPLRSNSKVQSYMEDVNILEKDDEIPEYVPPPAIAEEDANFQSKMEDLMYTLNDVIPGPLAGIRDDEMKWKRLVPFFGEKVEFQDPLVCFRGRNRLIAWRQRLAESGVVFDLHDIYYQKDSSIDSKGCVFMLCTAILPVNDLPVDMIQLGDSECGTSHHTSMPGNSLHEINRADLGDHADRANTGNYAGYEIGDGRSEEDHASKAASSGVLQLSGEAKFEMDKNGQISRVEIKWYRTAKQSDRDFTYSKLWLTGVMQRDCC